MRVRTGVGHAIVVGGAVVACGCAHERTSYLMLTVTDAQTHKPLSGVKVQADTCSRNHPFSVASMLGQTGPVSSVAYSDDAGRARVEYLDGRPVRIGVLMHGYPISVSLLEEPWRGATSVSDTAADSPHRIEVRVEPDADARSR